MPSINTKRPCVLALLTALLTTNTTALPTTSSSWSSSSPKLYLPYANYAGSHNTTSDLDIFLGVRYAASPAYENRWKRAQDPVDETSKGWIDATKVPPQCPQAEPGDLNPPAIYSPTESTDSEDCLFLNVYAPKGAKNLPVLVWIHGGGWDFNSAREFDPSPAIMEANNSFIGVVVQYRLGALGLLASDEMRADGGLNAAITDVTKALEWVQSYISCVGGDSSRVSIWGESAGGGTVLHLVAAEASLDSPRAKPLFQSAMPASAYMVTMGSCDSKFRQQQFANFSELAGCPGGNLTCLRQVSSDAVRTASYNLSSVLAPGYSAAYAPCIEGPQGYLKYNTVQRLIEGKVAGKHGWGGNNFAEGQGFVPPALVNDSSSDDSAIATTFLKEYFPVTDSEVTRALELYPANEYPDAKQRAGAMYQDVVFACTANWMLEAYGQNAWRYLYSVPPAQHAQDNAEEFPIFYGSRAPYSPSFYASFIGAATSFIASNPPNPNTLFPYSQAPSQPCWPSYADESKYMVLNLTQQADGTNVSTSYVTCSQGQAGLKERCDFWAQARIEGSW